MSRDAQDVLGLLALDYEERGGRLQLVCPLPEHADTNPSMAVFAAEGRFYCFGCEARGDLLDLYARVRGLKGPAGEPDRGAAEDEVRRLLGEAPRPPRRIDPAPERAARMEMEERLAALRGILPLREHARLGDRVDKAAWAYRKGLIDGEQLRGARRKFLKDTEGLLGGGG